MIKDFSNTLIRCSALGQIMSTTQGKTPMDLYLDAKKSLDEKQLRYDNMKNKTGVGAEKLLKTIEFLKNELPELEKNKDTKILSKSCQTYLIKTYALEKYNRIRDVETKEMFKGVIVEDDSIELFSKIEGKIYEKNKYRLNNGMVSGTPDLYEGESIDKAERVIDIKSSYDIESFLKVISQPLNSIYYWQLQGYMWLTGATKGTVAYCLVNTPEVIIKDQSFYLLKKLGVATEENDLYKREYEKMYRNMVFDDIPIEERILRIEIERNDEDIERIYDQVIECRKFLSEFQEKHLFFTKNYRIEHQSSNNLEEI